MSEYLVDRFRSDRLGMEATSEFITLFNPSLWLFIAGYFPAVDQHTDPFCVISGPHLTEQAALVRLCCLGVSVLPTALLQVR